MIRCLGCADRGLDLLAMTMTRTDFLRLMFGATSALAASQILRASPAVTEKMHSRLIPSTREPLPVVGCGTWRTFDVGQSSDERDRLREVLRILFDHAGSVIDSSPMYCAAESAVGDLLPAMNA